MKIELKSPTQLFWDSISAIHIAHVPLWNNRRKDIEFFPCIKEILDLKTIGTPSIHTEENFADVLTKGLPKNELLASTSKVRMVDIHTHMLDGRVSIF